MGFYETSMVKDCWATVKLKAAIFDLVKSDPSDISIKKLLAESGVGRTTFYSHFSNLDQLFCYIFYSDMIQRVPGMYNEDTFLSTVKANLEYLVANRTFYRKALESEGPHSLRQFIPDFWYHCHKHAYNEFYGKDPEADLPADVDLEFHIITRGLSKTAIEKLSNETEVIDPDKYAQAFKTCFSKTLLHIGHEKAKKPVKV
jgi:hypothetical protein